MKNNQNSTLDIVLYLMKKYLPQKKPITSPLKHKPDNRKVTITLGKWASSYLKTIKQLKLNKW